MALFDIAYPSTPEEDVALNRHAVLLITAVTQSASELPLKRVYVRNETGEETELKILASYYASTTGDPRVHDTLGSFRTEVFCLVPIAQVFTESALQIDFARNRAGFLLKKFPSAPPDEYILSDKNRNPDPKQPVSAEALKTLLLREFPDFEHEKFATQPPSS